MSSFAHALPTASLRMTAAGAALLLLFATIAHAQAVDDFERGTARWSAHPSDGVELRIGEDAGRSGRAMRLDFDFHNRAGYAIARRAVDWTLPPNYEISFWLRADAPVNNFELKLIDDSGDNVWWINRQSFTFPKEWRELVTKKRQISFAWGPAGGGEAKHIAALEVVVTAGTGGKGTVWIDDLELRELPANMPPPPRVTTVPWQSAAGGEQPFTVDMGDVRELGGLRIDWQESQFAADYDVELSRDGKQFETARRVRNGNGGRDWIWLPDASARFVRLSLHRGPAKRYALRDLVIEPVSWAPTINDFFAEVARGGRTLLSGDKSTPSRDQPGDYPRYLLGQQSYWTIVGADAGQEEALVGEDGNVEPFKAGFSIEPFVFARRELLTWADVTSSHTLERGYLPIPTVAWSAAQQSTKLMLKVTSAVASDSTLYVRYRLSSTKPLAAKLFLAIRPFQVNPSSQWLNTVGGASQIRDLAFADGVVTVNGNEQVHSMTTPDAFGAATFDEGNVVGALRAGRVPARTSAHDEFGYASGALAYDVALDGKTSRDVVIAVPLNEKAAVKGSGADVFGEIAAEWRRKLTNVAIDIPAAPQMADTIRSSIAYMLINRDGPALQPGSRSYERAWIRDGALMAPALLRLGHADVVRQFAEWFAPYQFENGKVPCCVDRRGADPVPENDSHGELIFMLAEYHRYTQDRSLIEKLWPHVDAAARYIDTLRAQRRTAEFTTGSKRAFYGLVPESISHEGYSAKPMHSYWDDFFTLAGLRDATFIASVLGHDQRAEELQRSTTEFRDDLRASIAASIAAHKIDYVPGAADLGDFDPSATSIAVAPLGVASLLPQRELDRTFERYLADFRARRDGKLAWDVYTPYEMRLIDAFVQRGERETAHELIRFFLEDRRPPGWNQWAEVVPREKRKPHFLGDMPHAWIASDFVRAALDLFAFDSEEGKLVVAAGVPASWVRETHLHVGALRTYSGLLDLKMHGTGRGVTIELGGDAKRAIEVRSPYAMPIKEAVVNGKRVAHTDASVTLDHLPARVELTY